MCTERHVDMVDVLTWQRAGWQFPGFPLNLLFKILFWVLYHRALWHGITGFSSDAASPGKES